MDGQIRLQDLMGRREGSDYSRLASTAERSLESGLASSSHRAVGSCLYRNYRVTRKALPRLGSSACYSFYKKRQSLLFPKVYRAQA